MKMLEETLVSDEIVTRDGRVFRPGNAELLASLPPDILREMARRRIEELDRYDAERSPDEAKA